ncbi:MAG: dephospho-CoA kinase [Thermoproteota archaeon]|nr:MAG: dephospho-CoA kinase [Candidatus Korarchaeota archaeon]
MGLKLKCEPKFRYVLLVGLPGSGKDVVAKILEEKCGYKVIVMSEVVREKVLEMGLSETRENFRKVGLELRKRLGPAAVALLCIEKAKELEKIQKPAGFVINGIRNIEEIDAFKEKFGDSVITLAILASKRIRFDRIRKRGRKGFDLIHRVRPMTYEDFLREDREEIQLFDMGNAIAWADVFIVNDGTLQELEDKVLSAVMRGYEVG